MTKYYLLDKVFLVGTEYRAEEDKLYVITALGCDSGEVIPTVDGQKIGKLHADFAPMHKTSSNLLGPFSLGELFIVVPPKKLLKFEGTATKVRAIGKIVELEPGEGIPNDYLARYNAHGKHYWTYAKASKSLGTDVAWATDQEIELLTLQPTSIEKYVFDSLIMVKISNAIVNPGDVALRIYVDDKPLDILSKSMGKLGLDVYGMPYPPSTSGVMEPFTLKDMPVEVEGDHTIKITAINVSGSSITPPSGTSIAIDLLVVYKRFQVK